MNDPRFIISKRKVLEQYEAVEEISDIVSYSSKTNPIITKILEEKTSCMFSIHTLNELENIKDLSRILFFAQVWTAGDIKMLICKNISNFVIDNEKDLEIFVKFLKNSEMARKINLFLRIKLKENTVKTERYFVFGMESDFVKNKIKELRGNKKIGRLGIHFHRKTQNIAEWDLKEEFESMIDSEIMKIIDVVNIGGGLPSEYANTNIKTIKPILSKIKEFKKWLNDFGIKLMVEPGRFIAAPSAKLVAGILRVYDSNIIINVSVYQGDMDALIVPVKLLVEGEKDRNDPQAKPFVIKGMTPCSMDIFRYRAYLLKEAVIEGNEIVFLNSGAYNFSTDFCGLKPIKTEIVEDFY